MLIAYAVAVTCFAMFQSVVIWGMTLVWRDQERKIKALKGGRPCILCGNRREDMAGVDVAPGDYTGLPSVRN